MYTVYMHKTPNDKVYIGITSRTTMKRWHSDGGGYKNNKLFWRAIQKYGWENIEHTILSTGLTKEAACAMEMNLIKIFDSNNPQNGYNLTAGGEGPNGWVPDDEFRRRVSEFWKGRRHSEESYQRMRQALHKPIRCIETGKIYNSGIEAAQDLGCSRALISMVCHGTKPSVKNTYHLEFAEV